MSGQDYEGYAEICTLLNLPYSEYDAVEVGNHKMILALTKKVIELKAEITMIKDKLKETAHETPKR